MPPACTPGCWTARAAPDAVAKKDESELVVALGPHLDGFLAALFGIEAETLALARETAALDPIHACKRLFVQRQAVKKYPHPAAFDGQALRAELEAHMGEPLTELAFATHVAVWEKAGADGGMKCRRYVCGLGNADAAGAGRAQGRNTVRRAASARLQPPGPGADHRTRRRHHAPPARSMTGGPATASR